MVSPIERATRAIAKAPVRLYRWTLKPLLGHECRHLPTCSEYALDAIELNGAWSVNAKNADNMIRISQNLRSL
jgi:putative membrane protein insertion efficiency factor